MEGKAWNTEEKESLLSPERMYLFKNTVLSFRGLFPGTKPAHPDMTAWLGKHTCQETDTRFMACMPQQQMLSSKLSVCIWFPSLLVSLPSSSFTTQEHSNKVANLIYPQSLPGKSARLGGI